MITGHTTQFQPFDELQKKLEEKDKEIAQLKEIISKLQAKIDQLNTRIDELTQKMKQMEQSSSDKLRVAKDLEKSMENMLILEKEKSKELANQLEIEKERNELITSTFEKCLKLVPEMEHHTERIAKIEAELKKTKSPTSNVVLASLNEIKKLIKSIPTQQVNPDLSANTTTFGSITEGAHDPSKQPERRHSETSVPSTSVPSLPPLRRGSTNFTASTTRNDEQLNDISESLTIDYNIYGLPKQSLKCTTENKK